MLKTFSMKQIPEKEKFTVKEFFYDESFNDYSKKIIINIPKSRYGGGESIYYASSITITISNGREREFR